jgi:hypothetical protein
MDTRNLTVKQILFELERYVNEHGEYCEVGSWDGGNDSGYVSIKEEFKLSDALEAEVEDVLEYGSWAGQYYSSGSVHYDNKEKMFFLSGNEDLDNYTTIRIDLDFDPTKVTTKYKHILVSICDGDIELYYLTEDTINDYVIYIKSTYDNYLLKESCEYLYNLLMNYIENKVGNYDLNFDNQYEIDIYYDLNKIKGEIEVYDPESVSVEKSISLDEFISSTINYYKNYYES